MSNDYATLENLDAWLEQAEKNLLALAKDVSEIKRIRTVQKSGVKEKALAVEAEKKRQFQEAYSNILRR
jgi:hypothetical protein